MTFVLNVDDVRLPEYMERGFKGGPNFNTTVLRGATGVEQRLINQTASKGKWTAAFGIRDQSYWGPLLTLGYTQRGMGYGFKFNDFIDNSITGQIIGTGDGLTTDFQIVKTYDSGVRTYTRYIYLPDSDGMVVSVNGSPTAAYTLQAGGIIRFNSAPAASPSTSISVTSNFFVPVRFAEDHMELSLYLSEDGVELAEIPAITLEEILPTST